VQSDSNLLAITTRVYNLLLYIYPAPFRREFGQEMTQVFRDDMHGTWLQKGPAGLLGLWLLTFIDLLKTALVEHMWEVFHMPLEKLTRWSGLVAAIGAPLFLLSFSSHTFWGFMEDLGLSGNNFIHPFVAGIGLVCIGIGLYGLYRRLPPENKPISTIMFGISLLGVLLGLGGMLIFEQQLSSTLIGLALILPMLGSMGMGMIALSKKALGILSFAPLVIVAATIGIAATANTGPSFPSTLTQLFVILHHLGWIILGIALMLGQTADSSEPGVLA
jgi:hypothetical protein